MSKKPIKQYTRVPELDQLLHEAEQELSALVGDFQAQRFIGVFANMPAVNKNAEINVWLAVYEAGKKAGGSKS